MTFDFPTYPRPLTSENHPTLEQQLTTYLLSRIRSIEFDGSWDPRTLTIVAVESFEPSQFDADWKLQPVVGKRYNMTAQTHSPVDCPILRESTNTVTGITTYTTLFTRSHQVVSQQIGSKLLDEAHDLIRAKLSMPSSLDAMIEYDKHTPKAPTTDHYN
jgi:hypothetical protein